MKRENKKRKQATGEQKKRGNKSESPIPQPR
ncbi:hypothetical protein CRD_02345 [Raphidiopsis brookii D9]|nr:hypothetical protein CRD_02345 [Raphidiopsis brookii D9]